MNTPVLYLVFNRPELVKKTFPEIQKVKPHRLFIAADGPRNIQGEDILCNEVREIILNGIDWECEVNTLFREKNLGCKIAVSSAIDWFFQHVDKGIILEDDILPSNLFFEFSSELLDKYTDDNRIMMISGLNVAEKWEAANQFYHFSYYGGIWGWATWKRAWSKYDVKISLWNNLYLKRLLLDFFPPEVRSERQSMYENLFNGLIDTWDLQWGFARYINSGLSIIPSYNLIQNIGEGEDATHTKGSHPWSKLKVYNQFQNKIHPTATISDIKYDKVHLGISENKKKSLLKKLIS